MYVLAYILASKTIPLPTQVRSMLSRRRAMATMTRTWQGILVFLFFFCFFFMATMDKTWQRCLVLVFFFVFWSEPDKGDDKLRSIYYLPIFLIPWLYESMHQCWSWLNRGFIFHLIFFNFQLPLLLVLKRGFISFFSSWIFSLTFNHLETYSPMRDVVFPSQPILNSWDMMIIIIMAKPEFNVHSNHVRGI